MYILTKKNLDKPFTPWTDPPYNQDTIKTLRRLVLWLYNAPLPGQKGSLEPAVTPWQAFLDTTNMPEGTEDSIRTAINYMLNITGIPPEQQWNETPNYIEPGSINECVALFHYEPSTTFDPPGVPFALGGRLNGTNVYGIDLIFNKDSLANEDFGKATRILMQKALMNTPVWIPDSNYFNYIKGRENITTGTFQLGPVNYPTPDEVRITKYLTRMNRLNTVLIIGYDNLSEQEPTNNPTLKHIGDVWEMIKK